MLDMLCIPNFCFDVLFHVRPPEYFCFGRHAGVTKYEMSNSRRLRTMDMTIWSSTMTSACRRLCSSRPGWFLCLLGANCFSGLTPDQLLFWISAS